ncbi:2-oxoglutarate dehydrogenase E1 component [Hyphomicrobium methylovorum]|uniref:2-oxoglutarate dehydrogenase E1 component n=1 Tax=Hyphomicrobium methylovorum TaxID=84 RepID=UPI0015E7C940|nr:2-oxoglutarate dehydrogenase E1 component [Hyphomicrobium methylovorum]MBA2126085.1 2-oxoglutarate dehydrogenase E1 component [Hyphomicrobium methylovorum]
MSRNVQNEAFLRTSFLSAANAPYIEDMQAEYERNPGAVSDEWRRFFESIKEPLPASSTAADGPAWAPPLESLVNREANSVERDLVGALTGDYGELERTIRNKIERRAQSVGFEMSPAVSFRATQDSIRALMLIRAYRFIGHLAADLDPLGLADRRIHRELLPETYGFTEADLDRPIFIDRIMGLETASMRQILTILRRTYCRQVGFQFAHITDPTQKAWIQERIEGPEKDIRFTPEGQKAILNKLIETETFEKFCDLKYTGTKRFGLDGAEAMIPALEQIIKRGGHLGVRDIALGMAHRGRLNVLANVMSKPLRAIFKEFKGGSFKPDDVEGSGDVKYHLGASSDRMFDGNTVHLSLTANPSHLEIVDPVVLGKVRAKQDQYGCSGNERGPVLPLLIHGDAAFAGQGVVAECFGLSGLRGHRTGGSIHFIINNQIGFTTAPHHSRSSPYCSDVALMIEAPIFHVNGDSPEAVVHVAKIATEFRQRFQKPVVIDMFCYRRHGHNETDEPMFTQPAMYRRIKAHPTVVEIYSKYLIDEGVLTAAEFTEMKDTVRANLDNEFSFSDGYKPNKADWLDGRWSGFTRSDSDDWRGNTGIPIETLKDVGRRLTAIPNDFHIHKTVSRLLERRREMVEKGTGIDWAMGEHLAFASLLMEGFRVRLSGQDCERGTFSQRHAVFIDQETERRFAPLKHLAPNQARFEIVNSMLSEEAVLGFEYGYSLAEPNALTLWEAQFGDFANGAQVIFDQFISSAERKWLRMSGLVCLLPHGYEGQGPEHSSARLERFLQLSAEDNWQVANCTTPANYFHILRRQLHRNFRKPLILMTPKSLLRHKRVTSKLDEFGPNTSFHRILWDDAERGSSTVTLRPDDEIKRVVLCTGKVYYDLLDARDTQGRDDIYLLRLEQLYPFPARALLHELGRFKAAEFVWCQEEPKNMGAWNFMDPNIEWVLNHLGYSQSRARYAGRSASASTATGLLSQHIKEQTALVAEALGT